MLPLVIYRGAVRRRRGLDPAAIVERLFATQGWKDSWRDGIYDFLHFHTRTHEVCAGVRPGNRMIAAQFLGKPVVVRELLPQDLKLEMEDSKGR